MISRRAFGLGFSATVVAPSFLPSVASASSGKGDPLAGFLQGRVAPGGFVAVSKGGRLVSFRPWGHASKTFGQPVSERTLFHLGSNGKQVTALAVLRLVQAGKIDLGQPVGAYLHDLPEAWASIPVHHLLSHTSGLVDYLSVFTEWDRPQPKAKVIEELGKLPLNHAPGDAFAYTNTGYLLLGWLMDAVSGTSYKAYVGSLLKEAAMPSARLDDAADLIAERAEAYTWEDNRIVHARRMESSVSAAADGGVLMSAQDVGPWRAVLDRGTIVPRQFLREHLRSAPMNTGRSAPYNHGLMLDRIRGRSAQLHGGGVPGFLSFWAALPDMEMSALAVSNYDGPKGPDVRELAFAALESTAPGSTFRSLAARSSDVRAKALQSLLQRGNAAPDPAVLAPEITALGPRTRGVPRMRDPISAVAEVESYQANGGEMVRYRIEQSTGTTHRLAGWTTDNRLFFFM